MGDEANDEDKIEIECVLIDGDINKSIYHALTAYFVRARNIQQCGRLGIDEGDVSAALDGNARAIKKVSRQLLELLEARRVLVRKRRDKDGTTIKKNAGPTLNHGHIAPTLLNYMAASMIGVCSRKRLVVPAALSTLVEKVLQADIAVTPKSVRATELFDQIMKYAQNNPSATNAEIAAAVGTSRSEISQYREAISEIFENDIAPANVKRRKLARRG